MYSRSTGYPWRENSRSVSAYRQGVRIPANYAGTAIGATPPDGVPPATDGITLPEVTVKKTVESTAKAASESEGTFSRTAAELIPNPSPTATATAVSPMAGILSGRHFPFGHGVGYEELLILGLILCLIRETGADAEEDISATVLLLCALLFLG